MSLYSAQLVATAREELNKQLQDKVSSPPLQKTEKHNPYHYKETVHQKCKHHGQHEQKEGLAHKKLLEHISHTRNQQGQGQRERRLEDEKQQISAEMRRWSKIVEKCLKGEHKFSEEELHAQHTGFYKWMLFIEELFRHYENSLKTQTSIHNIDSHQHKSERNVEEPFEVLLTPKIQHKTHQVKLPHLPNKERMEFLQNRVAHLQKQLHIYQNKDKTISKQIHDLENLNKTHEQKERTHTQQLSKVELGLSQILNEVQGFHNNLLVDLKQPEKLKDYPQKIQSQLAKIHEFKNHLSKQKKEDNC